MNTKQTLLNILLTIKKNGPKYQYTGICVAVANVMGSLLYIPDRAMEELLSDVMETWPKWSGSRTFPIPGTGGKSKISTYVDFAITRGNMWDPETEYGRLRLELLDHCITYLQSETVTNKENI